MDDDTRYYTTDEVRALLAALSGAQLRKLALLVRTRAHGAIGMDRNDLLNQVILDVMDGVRKWRRGVSLEAFFSMAMRSIASNAYKHQKLGIKFGIAKQQDPSREGMDDPMTLHPDPSCSHEQREHAERMLSNVMAALSSDHEMLAIAMGRAEGKTDAEIQNACRMEAKKFEAARKRLYRFLIRKFCGGSET